MKPLIAFIAGLLVGWWVKPKPKKTAKFVFVGEGKPHFDKEMWAEPCQEQDEIPTVYGTSGTNVPTHSDNVVDVWFNENGLAGWKFKNGQSWQIEWVGSNEEYDATLDDTQPIRISSQSEGK